MGQVDQATQANASLVEETSAAAEELAAQARSLLDVVSFFKVEDEKPKASFTRQPAASKGATRVVQHRQNPAPVKPVQSRNEQDDFSEF
jgi:methyl-accepting chemotaxis protein